MSRHICGFARRMKMKKLNVALASLAVIALSACSTAVAPDDTDVNGAATTQPLQADSRPMVDSAPAEAVSVKEYFDAFAGQGVEEMRTAADNAAAGSLAQDYLVHQANIGEASTANGYGVEEQSVDYKKDAVEITSFDYTTKYADIEFDGGKIASFTIDGKDVSDRLVVGSGEVVETSDELASFEVLSAYQSISNYLFVVVKYKTNDRPADFGYTATYRDPSGRQINDSDSVTPSSVVEESYQLGTVTFPSATIGGTMKLHYTNDDDGSYISDDVEVPLPKK